MKQVQHGYHQLDEANCWFIEEKKRIYERSIQLLGLGFYLQFVVVV